MDDFDAERSNYANMHESPPHSPGEGLWKTYGTSISLGFLATTVLICMFIIIAIIEQFFRPNASFRFIGQQASHMPIGPRSMQKLIDQQTHVRVRNTPDISILMPGEKYPTYIAHPTPLPCSREGVYWPSHYQHKFVNP